MYILVLLVGSLCNPFVTTMSLSGDKTKCVERLLKRAIAKCDSFLSQMQFFSELALKLEVNKEVTFQEYIAAIKALGVNDLAGFILFFISSSALNPVTY